MKLLSSLFSVDKMLKHVEVKGEIPSTKDTYKKLAYIAVPSVIEMVFMSIIGSVDMVMLRGLESPATAIAAVGLAGQPRLLTLALFFALNTGVTAIVARRKGENKKEDANRALRNAILIVLLLSIIVSAVTLNFSRQLLMLAGAKPDTIDMGDSYFRIITLFMPINALTMCINAAQRGVGNTKTTMYVNLTSNLVNVFFDIFLIYGLKSSNGNYIIPAMGVAGDAWATGIGIFVGFILCLVAIMRDKTNNAFLKLSLKDNWRFHKETVMSIVKVGGNAMVEQGVVRVGFFTYAAIVASLGTASVAAHQVGMQFLNLSFTFGDGIAVASTSLVGQMLGKKRPDIAAIYGRCAQRVALCVGILIGMTMIIFRGSLIKIFLDTSNPNNVESYILALSVLIVVGLFQPIQMSNVVISGCLRGAGDNLHVALIMMICVVLIRPSLSFIAINFFHWGLIGAWCSALIDMSIRLTLMYKRFRSGIWQFKKV
jgi:putative efflux protein, MATE family